MPNIVLDGQADPVVDIAVTRADGRWVAELDEDRQGTILKSFDPDYLPPEPGEPEDDIFEANQKVKIKLTWSSALPISAATLQESTFYPAPDTGGLLKIYDGKVVTKDETQRTLALGSALDGHFALWQNDWGSKVLEVEARRTGTTLLTFTVVVNGKKFEDRIRVSAIPCTPKSGRIIFVRNGGAGGASPHGIAPFDDFDRNASRSVMAAVGAAPAESNVLIGPGVYREHNIAIRHSCAIAGLGGNYSVKVEYVHFDWANAPVLDAHFQGPVFKMVPGVKHVSLTVAGLRICDQSTGSSFDLDGGLNMEACDFVSLVATPAHGHAASRPRIHLRHGKRSPAQPKAKKHIASKQSSRHHVVKAY